MIFAQNGIPWWYDIGLPAAHPAPPDLSFLDPGGALRAAVPKERIIGGVIFSSNEVIEPGVVANLSPERNMLLIGECDDRASERIGKLRALLEAASIASAPAAQIRETIWSKLLTNMSMSVLCLLTGQTARGVRDEPALQQVIPRLLDEANAVAQSCIPDVKRVTRSGPAPEHKPSILQDYELGRAMEIDVLVRAPAAFARAAGLSTPMLDLIAGLAIQRARDKGLYKAGTRTKGGNRTCTSRTRSASSPAPRAELAKRSRAPLRQPAPAASWSPISRPRATAWRRSPAISTASRSPPMSARKRTSRR